MTRAEAHAGGEEEVHVWEKKPRETGALRAEESRGRRLLQGLPRETLN